MQLKQQHRLIVDSVILGVAGALAARAFEGLLHWCQTLFLAEIAGVPSLVPSSGAAGVPAGVPHGSWMLPLATTLGGLIAGVIVYSLAPESEGHGTDTVVNAFHNLAGRIRARVPAVKLVASAITIGSGGSAGREGPTALISAGVGSVFANWLGRSEEERRLLILVGMAAGLSAVFRSPIGTAIFAVEVLYSEMEFETGALLYTMLASIVAYALNGFMVGYRPLFEVPAGLGVPHLEDYAWYIMLGAASGLVATLLPTALYRIRDAFHLLPFPSHFKPALGGLAVGLLAVAYPQLLGGGYEWIQAAIDGRIAAMALLVLAFGKILTFGLTIGSGGSGGVFAPSLYVGAMLGGFLAQAFHQPAAAFAVVGMAAVFGGAARVPIATLLMVTEMTGGYHLLVPAALSVLLSCVIQMYLSRSLRYDSLYEAQVPLRPYSPSHYVEQLRSAFELLQSHEFSSGSKVGRLELISVLGSGVPVTLPDGKRMRIGALRSKSRCVGQYLQSGCLAPSGEQVEFILVLRENRVLLPHRGLTLKERDQLVAIASDAAWARLREHLEFVEPRRPRPS